MRNQDNAPLYFAYGFQCLVFLLGRDLLQVPQLNRGVRSASQHPIGVGVSALSHRHIL